MKLKDRGERRWFVNGQGQTFAVIDGPVEFRMGSPPTEPERNAARKSHAAWSSPAGSPSPPRRSPSSSGSGSERDPSPELSDCRRAS